jgi:hypothetical protein
MELIDAAFPLLKGRSQCRHRLEHIAHERGTCQPRDCDAGWWMVQLSCRLPGLMCYMSASISGTEPEGVLFVCLQVCTSSQMLRMPLRMWTSQSWYGRIEECQFSHNMLPAGPAALTVQGRASLYSGYIQQLP